MTGRKATRAFTLIELLVVIAIIGVLSSVVLASINIARQKADDARRLADMHSLMQALEMYANDNNGNYPNDPPNDCTGGPCNCGGDWPSGAIAPPGSPGVTGNDCVDDMTELVTDGYIAKLPSDPEYANTPYNYQYCGDGKDYGLIMWNDTLGNPGGFCRPQVPFVLSQSCPFSAYPECQ